MPEEVLTWIGRALGVIALGFLGELWRRYRAHRSRTSHEQLRSLRDESGVEYPSDYPTARPERLKRRHRPEDERE